MQQRADPCPGGRLGLELVIHLQGGVVHLLAHGIAGVGGGSLLGLQRVGGGNGGLHIGVVGHDLLLERGVAGLGCSLILCGDLIAIAAVASLAEEGLREHFDYRFVETVSHSSALYNAINGKARAALVSYSMLLLSPPELQQETIIWKVLANIPGQFYIAHSRLPQARQQAIKGALLAFEKSKEGRAFFEKTRHGGLREPSAEDYAQIDRILPETRKQLGALLR